jgi:hypothetical protein
MRVEVAVAPIVGDAHRVLRLPLKHGLIFGGRDVPASRLRVAEGIDRLAARAPRGLRSFRSRQISLPAGAAMARPINTPSTFALRPDVIW